VDDPVRREAGVERDVGGVALEYGEHAGVGLERMVQQERDPLTGTDAVFAQVPGEPVGPGVELAEGERPLPDDLDGGRVRVAVRALRRQLGEEMVEALSRASADRLVPVVSTAHASAVRQFAGTAGTSDGEVSAGARRTAWKCRESAVVLFGHECAASGSGVPAREATSRRMPERRFGTTGDQARSNRTTTHFDVGVPLAIACDSSGISGLVSG
jgi:hypothetical protein